MEEVGEDYWVVNLGSPKPKPEQVLDILVLIQVWGDENSDGIDNFDFTLPGDVTNYLISVSFEAAGNVKEITMES